ncbi:MAG: TonB-dependent receptor [Verrucomicrobia bacterium]|nr:TonB-dependent receptor [Verrucomicrobiota bacterium]
MIPLLPRVFSSAARLVGAFLFATSLSATFAQSAASGVVTGHVLNKATGSYLAGAEVRIAGTARVAYTDATGYFEIANVGPGSVKLQVSYSDLDPAEDGIVVAAGERAVREVALTSKVYGKTEVVQLGAFVVASEREGRASALTQQRRAENMVNVISSDEFPNVAGGSIGEFLRNVPGVVIDYSNADPRSIRVRGFDPNLNAVSVDGMRAANAASGNTNRVFEIDQISLQNVESVEVTKSNRPDQEADTGGGSVNMVSKSAFKLKGRRISYTVMINGNSQDWSPLTKTPGPNEGKNESYKWYPGYTFSFMNSFLNNTLGVVVTANDFTFYSGQPNASIGWTQAPAAFNRPRDDPNGVYASSFGRSYNYNFTRRKALSLNLDYKLAANTSVYLNSQVNTSYIRAWGRGMTLNAPAPSTNTALGTNVTAPGFSEESTTVLGDINGTTITALNSISTAFATASSGDLLNKKGVGTTFSGGLRHQVRGWKFDAAFGASQSTNHYHLGDPRKEGENMGRADFYLRGLSYTLTTPAGTHTPTLVQTGGPSLLDLNNFVSQNRTTNLTTNTATVGSFTTANTREVNAIDRIYSGKANLRRDFVNLRFPFYLQTGLSWRQQKRDIDFATRHRWFYVGPDGISGTPDDTANLGQFTETNAYRRPFGYQYPVPSLDKITDFYVANPRAFQEDIFFRIQQEGQNLRHIVEKVAAAYIEGNINIGKLGVLAGVRGERTTDAGNGPVSDLRAATGITDRIQQAVATYTTKRAGSNTAYTNWFPSVQAKYNVANDLIARASFTQSIGRQNLGNIIPGVTVGTGTIVNLAVNNPGLLPQIYFNQDYSLEYYLKPVGEISVGYFSKKIKNYTRSVTDIIARGFDYDVGIDTDTYADGFNTITRSTNTGDASVKGYELKYSQQLSAYSEWLRGLGVFANYTYLSTMGNYGATTTATTSLANFVPHTFNAGTSYTRAAFTGSVKYNYKGHYTSGAPTYQYNRGTYDIALSWQFRREAVLFGEVKNITNAPRQAYNSLERRLSAYATDGAIFNFGVKGTF